MNIPKELTAATGIPVPGEIIMAAADSHLTIKILQSSHNQKKNIYM